MERDRRGDRALQPCSERHCCSSCNTGLAAHACLCPPHVAAAAVQVSWLSWGNRGSRRRDEWKKGFYGGCLLTDSWANVAHQERFGLSHLKALALLSQSNDLGNEYAMPFRCQSAQHQVSVSWALQKFKLSTYAISDDVDTHRTSPGLYLSLNYY